QTISPQPWTHSISTMAIVVKVEKSRSSRGGGTTSDSDGVGWRENSPRSCTEVLAMWSRTKPAMPTRETALPGRDAPAFEISGVHAVNGSTIVPPYPENTEVAVFALGCF